MTLFITNPLPVVDWPADAAHFTKGRGGFAPLIVLLHHTGGTDSRDWLSTTSSPPVSSHRTIDKAGVIYKHVNDEDTAYTAGFGIVGAVDPDANDPLGVARNLNQITLHIELENMGDGKDKYTPAQLQSCAAQIVEWFGKFGFLAILHHSHVDPNKNDPKGLDRVDLDRRILALLPARVAPMPGAIYTRLETVLSSMQHDQAELAAALTAMKGV